MFCRWRKFPLDSTILWLDLISPCFFCVCHGNWCSLLVNCNDGGYVRCLGVKVNPLQSVQTFFSSLVGLFACSLLLFFSCVFCKNVLDVVGTGWRHYNTTTFDQLWVYTRGPKLSVLFSHLTQTHHLLLFFMVSWNGCYKNLFCTSMLQQTSRSSTH